MPHTVITAPGATFQRSLGGVASWWMRTFTRHARGDATGMRVKHSAETEDFIYYAYAHDEHGDRMHLSAFYSRPKGCDKSGLAARLGLFEALGPARFAGWAKGGETYEFLGKKYKYAPGEAMGKPVVDPLIRIMATAEDQTGNTFDSIYWNLHSDNADRAPLAALNASGMQVNKDKIILPWSGQIVPSTATGASKDGGLESFVIFDESHLYNTPVLRKMHSFMTNNVNKRAASGAWYIETTTMYAVGEESIAEQQYGYMEKIREGKAKRAKMLFDHRYGDITDEEMEDVEKVRAALRESYGETLIRFDEDGNKLPGPGWISIESLIDDIYNPVNAENKNPRRFKFNAPSNHGENTWLQPAELSAVSHTIGIEDIKPGEYITLGFDGSINRDATVLMGCRVSDGHLFVIHYEEKPDGPEAVDWKVPVSKFHVKIDDAFNRFRVVGFFADPAHWRDDITIWEKKYGEQLKVTATKAQIISFDMSLTGMVSKALDRLHVAILNKTASITDHPFVKRQFLNAVSEERFNGQLLVKKPTPASPRTIDSIYAGMLAFEARARLLGLTNEYAKPAVTARPKKAIQLR